MCRRQIRESCRLDPFVTKTTIEAEIADMMRVAERNRLCPRQILIGGIGRSPYEIGQSHRPGGRDKKQNDDNHRNAIGTGTE